METDRHDNEKRLDELPDEYVPLYRREVRRVTGISAGKLAAAIRNRPEQFGPGVVQRTDDGQTVHVRFNPYRHVLYLKEPQEWHNKQQNIRTTYDGTHVGPSASGVSAELSAHEMTRPVIKSGPKNRSGAKSAHPLAVSMMTGADLLAQMLKVPAAHKG